MVKALNIAVLPIAFCVLGVVLWRLRLARRQTQRI
jgi:cytochrome c-type biogenesis protein CcmH/NrfF